MGKGLANPVGTFWSVVMMLEHLGEPAAAARLMAAIESVTADPSLHTRDLGGTATTAQVTAAVCARLRGEGRSVLSEVPQARAAGWLTEEDILRDVS